MLDLESDGQDQTPSDQVRLFQSRRLVHQLDLREQVRQWRTLVARGDWRLLANTYRVRIRLSPRHDLGQTFVHLGSPQVFAGPPTSGAADWSI